MRRMAALTVALAVTLVAAGAEEPGHFSLRAAPAAHLPLGSSGELFGIGTGAELTAAYRPGFLTPFELEAGGDFMILPLQSADAVHTAAGFAGPGLWLPLGERFELLAAGRAGYYLWYPAGWEAAEAGGGGLLLGGGLGARFCWSEGFALGASLTYRYFDQLYNGMSFTLALSYTLPWRPSFDWLRMEPQRRPEPLPGGNEGLVIETLTVPTLFPVLYAYYHDHPLGSLTLKNSESRPAEDIAVSFFVERYMDDPKELAGIERLPGGETARVELFGLFTEELMEITEGTKASARITLSYTSGGKRRSRTYSPAIEFHNRNALTWSDDRKIAAFVTAKDPEILAFARRVAGWMQERQNPAVDESLQKGMALFAALKSYGLRYEIDPTTPFRELSASESAVDFLQFPRQTLQFTSGDCDDLTALYTSLLEAVGVETAAITVPGHIYPAFALQSAPEEARRGFSRPEDLLFLEGKAWVPVEITLCQDSFAEAWKQGAKQWREHSGLGQARLYPTRWAWQTYQAVGFRGRGRRSGFPSAPG